MNLRQQKIFKLIRFHVLPPCNQVTFNCKGRFRNLIKNSAAKAAALFDPVVNYFLQKKDPYTISDIEILLLLS